MIFRYFRNFSRFDVLSKYGRRFSKFWKKLKWTVEIVQKIIKFDKPGVQYIIGTSLSKCHCRKLHMTLSITKSSYREFQVMAGRMTPPKPQSRQRQDEVAPEMTSRQRQRQCSLNLVEMFSKSHRMFSKSHRNVQHIRSLSLHIVTPIRCT